MTHRLETYTRKAAALELQLEHGVNPTSAKGKDLIERAVEDVMELVADGYIQDEQDVYDWLKEQR